MQKFLIAAFLAATLALPVAAEAPKPFPTFSAKRVKPPGKGAKQRITVQIAPQPAAPAAASQAVQAAALAPSSPGGSYAWFWQTVSPALSETGPGRLEPALIRLGNPPSGLGVRAPRLQGLHEIADTYGREILLATVGTRVSPALALAVISVESSGKADAVSKAGAQGLMQLMPATATRFGVSDSLNAAQNIQGGVRFLDFLMEKFDGDPILVLAGYNAGENSIAQHDGVPPFTETRDYVPKVLAAFKVAKGLCKTPPQLISDGCVFQLAGN
ncbi:lytic transglycosylase domain-containing protein [Mesobacterium sp. TK19101]|uniref:Lytic transglycosylase domain-containing protein n=1 Tax=Mesobacterium hydrothermale TaxID=3111907 RepID=A0ABU6HJG3_9RHOB|nr:lytic transglycosylase domain-containing protein [Mesobacterium sp. TK19101]MEC3862014.1 lytic transglycosylase domain-containing protein [Mesobacterium sp. TK19101]